MAFTEDTGRGGVGALLRRDGRAAALLCLFVFGLVLLGLALWLGKSRALSVAGVPPMALNFADLRVFPAALAQYERGGIPELGMTDDLWGRPYNYPRLWLAFMRFPVEWVGAVGFVMIVGWLVALLAWCGRLSCAQGVAIGLLLCSPPLLLAYERGNSDLIVGVLLLAALHVLDGGRRAAFWAASVVMFALKLYPIVSAVAWLRLGWRRAWPWCLAMALVAGGYTVLYRDEIRLALHNTPRGMFQAYGSSVVVSCVEWAVNKAKHSPDFAIFKTWAMLGAAGLAVLMFSAGWRRRGGAMVTTGRWLDGFRAGAAIYATTFIFGASYDYRLLFLALCVPWLWAEGAADESVPSRRLRRATGVVLLAVVWINPTWWFPLFAPSELCGWGLLGLLCWWLGRTIDVAEAPPTEMPRAA